VLYIFDIHYLLRYDFFFIGGASFACHSALTPKYGPGKELGLGIKML
jgi:hypothetical protein